MPQSLVKNYIHLVFSTKYRVPSITLDVQEELFCYLGGICKSLECQPIRVGGFRDHVHVLCLLSKNITMVHLVRDLKSFSSKWIKSRFPESKDFYWQNGYGAFSVNPSQVEIVSQYIQNQAQHHSKKSFQEEYRVFLKKYKVEYDERYVWD